MFFLQNSLQHLTCLSIFTGAYIPFPPRFLSPYTSMPSVIQIGLSVEENHIVFIIVVHCHSVSTALNCYLLVASFPMHTLDKVLITPTVWYSYCWLLLLLLHWSSKDTGYFHNIGHKCVTGKIKLIEEHRHIVDTMFRTQPPPFNRLCGTDTEYQFCKKWLTNIFSTV